MNDNEKIIDALKKLDVNNPGHWTVKGAPTVEIVKFFAGGLKVTAKDIEDAAPGFNKENCATYFNLLDSADAQKDPQTDSATNVVTTQQEAADENAQAAQEDPVKDDSGPTLEEKIAYLGAKIDDATKERDYLSDMIAKMQDARDELLNQQTAEQADAPSATMQYLEAQKRNLQARAEHMENLRNAGITQKTLRDLLPRAAPIDAVRKR